MTFTAHCPEANVIARGFSIGDYVSIEERGRYKVVGFECAGDCVQLEEPHASDLFTREHFTVYAWRVQKAEARR